MIQEQLFLSKLAQLLDSVFVLRDIPHLTLINIIMNRENNTHTHTHIHTHIRILIYHSITYVNT